jgi:signal transduction histidine kinase
MLKALFLSPFMLLCTLCAHAQTSLDSVFRQLHQPNEQGSLHAIRYLFSNEYLDRIEKNKHDSVLKIIIQRLENENIDSKNSSPFLKSVTYSQIGFYYLHHQNVEKGITYLEKGKREAKNLNKRALHFFYEKNTTYYQSIHRLDSTLVYAEKEMELAKEIADDTLIFNASYRLGGILYGIQDYAKARNYFHYVAQNNLNGVDFLRTVYNTIALSYQKQAIKESKNNLFDSARAYYDTAYHYAMRQPKDLFWQGLIRGNIGDSYFYEGLYQKAIPYLLEDLHSSLRARKNKMSENALISMNRLFAAYVYLDKMDSASLFRDSLENNLDGENARALFKEFYHVSALYFKKKGDLSNALKFLDRYLVFSDSMSKVENIAEARKLESQYVNDFQRKKVMLELEEQKKDNEKKNQMLTVISLIAVLLLGLIYSLYRVNRDKIKANRLLNLQKASVSAKNEELNQINEELKNTLDVVAQQKESISLQATELQELNQLKDKLFSIISHDLRSPLGAMKGMLTILEMGGLSEAEMQIITKDVKKRLDGLDHALNNLLVWSKAQMSGQIALKENIELHPLIEGKINLYSGTAALKKIEFANLVPQNIVVHANLNHLRVVLRNLIGNALKFTPEGGKIEIIATTNENFVRIGVKDNGIGMSGEQIDKLFDKNTHFTTRGTKDEKGTGLGLLLCKEFVEKDGGQIWVESKPKQGSTFWVEFPLQKALIINKL